MDAAACRCSTPAKMVVAGSNETRPRLVYLGNHDTNADADNFTMYKITLRTRRSSTSPEPATTSHLGCQGLRSADSPNTDGIDPSARRTSRITNSYISDATT